MVPSEEYAQRLRARELRVAHYERIHIRLGNARLVLALLTVVMAWASFKAHQFSPWWLAAPVAVFIGIAAYHSRVLRARDMAQRAAVFYIQGIARVQDRWADTGETGERFDDAHHVYASDLDLFGKGSLFQLLSTARTRMGEDTLAKWLLSPSPVADIRERHCAISELREELDLREDLAVLGEDVGAGVHPEDLLKWAEAPNQMKPLWIRWLAFVLALLSVSGAFVWAYWKIATPLVVIVVIEAIVTYRLGKPLEEVLHGTEHAFRDLDLLSGVLARMENHTFQAHALQTLQRQLRSNDVRSSQAIAQLRTLVDLINSRHNTIVRIIDAPLMYSLQVAFAAERWRNAYGAALRPWVTAMGEMEALLSLATYSFEHPSNPFPVFTDGTASFDGKDVGHPLVPAAMCVRNDVSIREGTRILLVSGSNMSGKSTLLRSVGINVVLAMAGAPVRARDLRLTPLRVGASIRINDSLQEGSSRFYAEITRLRQIFDLAGGDPPLLFLLDELLQGTNSKDRRVGAEGILRTLLDRGAIGLVSTHDLALTDIGGSGDGTLHNVHFQDDFENGKMTFDYKLRDGVVTKSNGLELMRSIGLDV
ncbi:MAG TPA: mismatch repair protein [Candidatus Sulfotelmatobacter sp.]|nr:mismatch repair protein [Candidatus Sulfotelmatobacter sp.]